MLLDMLYDLDKDKAGSHVYHAGSSGGGKVHGWKKGSHKAADEFGFYYKDTAGLILEMH